MSATVPVCTFPSVLEKHPAVKTKAWCPSVESLVNDVRRNHALYLYIEDRIETGKGDKYDFQDEKSTQMELAKGWSRLIGHCDTVCEDTNEMSIAVAAVRVLMFKLNLDDIRHVPGVTDYDFSPICRRNSAYIASLAVVITRLMQHGEKNESIKGFYFVPYELYPVLKKREQLRFIDVRSLMEDVLEVIELLLKFKPKYGWDKSVPLGLRDKLEVVQNHYRSMSYSLEESIKQVEETHGINMSEVQCNLDQLSDVFKTSTNVRRVNFIKNLCAMILETEEPPVERQVERQAERQAERQVKRPALSSE